MLKVFFGRKICDFEELKDLTRDAWRDGIEGSDYVVTKGIELSDEEFKTFADDLLRDQTWIESEDGGPDENGALRCIRVTNQLTGEKILVDSEGYNYPRYTAIEV